MIKVIVGLILLCVDMFLVFGIAPRYLSDEKIKTVRYIQYFLQVEGVIVLIAVALPLGRTLIGFAEFLAFMSDSKTLLQCAINIFMLSISIFCFLANQVLSNGMVRKSENKSTQLYNELVALTDELRPYYDIDKVKSYSVYVWTKDGGSSDSGENVFDIQANEILFYNKNHTIIEEAAPLIEKIQNKLKELSV